MLEEIRLVGEHWQDNVIGLKWSEKLERAISGKHLQEQRLAKAELDLKQLRLGKLIEQNIVDSTFVTVLKSKKNPKILDIGFNVPEDMFMNNFGIWFSQLFAPGGLTY